MRSRQELVGHVFEWRRLWVFLRLLYNDISYCSVKPPDSDHAKCYVNKNELGLTTVVWALAWQYQH